METVQGNYAYQNPSAKKNAFVLPLNMIASIVISLILGLGVGFFVGQMSRGPIANLGAGLINNPIFTAKPIYLAPVEGTLVEKNNNQITIEKNSAKLEIEVAMTAPVLIQDANIPGQVVTKTIGDVEVGSLIKGSVQVSEEFMSGNKNGKITGSSFFVTKK